MAEFDRNHPHGHTTRDGRKAEIVFDNLVSDFPIAAKITEADGTEHIDSFMINGSWGLGEPDRNDLVNAPAPKRKFEAWLNIYKTKSGDIRIGSAFLKLEEADHSACVCSLERIACIHVTGEEGDGLE